MRGVCWYGQDCACVHAQVVCVGGSVALLELASEASAETLSEALSGSTVSFEVTISAIASSEALDSSTEPVSLPDLEALSSTGGFVSVDFFPLSMKLSSEEALDSPKSDL